MFLCGTSRSSRPPSGGGVIFDVVAASHGIDSVAEDHVDNIAKGGGSSLVHVRNAEVKLGTSRHARSTVEREGDVASARRRIGDVGIHQAGVLLVLAVKLENGEPHMKLRGCLPAATPG